MPLVAFNMEKAEKALVGAFSGHCEIFVDSSSLGVAGLVVLGQAAVQRGHTVAAQQQEQNYNEAAWWRGHGEVRVWFGAEMRTYLCTRSLSVLRPHVLLDTACAVFSFCRYKTI